jgi:hypothetical protein
MLGLMFDSYIDPYRLFLAASDLAISIYALYLWCFALRRSRLPFFRILVFTSAVFLLIHIMHVVIVCTEDTLKFDVFGIHAYANFAHIMYVIDPIAWGLMLFGYTLLVRWIIRERAKDITASKT